MPSNEMSEVVIALRAAGVSEETIRQIQSNSPGSTQPPIDSILPHVAAAAPLSEGEAHVRFVETGDTNVYRAVAEDPYAPTAWGQPNEEDFQCPSGQLCRVRRVDIMDLLAQGTLNSVDFLTDVVENKHIPAASRGSAAEKAEKAAQEATTSLTQNPEKLSQFKSAVDAVLPQVVVKPRLFPVPPSGEDRIEGRVYLDSVSSTDKFAIFNFAVSGKKEARNVAQFREQASEPLGTVENVAGVQSEAVDVSRTDKP